jgi:hypothetical protein
MDVLALGVADSTASDRRDDTKAAVALLVLVAMLLSVLIAGTHLLRGGSSAVDDHCSTSDSAVENPYLSWDPVAFYCSTGGGHVDGPVSP